jgi:hypothetical protein
MSLGAGAGATRSRGRRNAKQGPAQLGAGAPLVGMRQWSRPRRVARRPVRVCGVTSQRESCSALRRAHLWGCDRGAGQGASTAGPRASAGSDPQQAGAPLPPSNAPTCGDATVAPAKARRPPALARLRGAAAPGGRKLGAEWPRGDPGIRHHMRPSAPLPAPLFERPSPGRIPEGTLFRPPTRPLCGDATQESAASRRHPVDGFGRDFKEAAA